MLMLNVMICYVSKRCKMYCCMCLSNFCYFFGAGHNLFFSSFLLSLFSSDLSCRVSKMDFTSVSQNLIKMQTLLVPITIYTKIHTTPFKLLLLLLKGKFSNNTSNL